MKRAPRLDERDAALGAPPCSAATRYRKTSEATAVAFFGTVAHVAFSMWLLLGMMFPPEFRGADFTPIPLTLGQGALVFITWLVILLVRASDRMVPSRTN